jgi:hypothetical protein
LERRGPSRLLDRCEQSIGSPMTNFALRTPSGYLIGAIGVVGVLSADAHSAEFGYWLAQSYRATLKKLEDNTKPISISSTINRVKSAAL